MKIRSYAWSTFRSVSRFLPRQVRSYLRNKPTRFRIAKPLDIVSHRPRKEFSGRNVIVAGLFSSPTGIGKAATLVALTLERQGSLVTCVDISSAMGLPLISKTSIVPLSRECERSTVTDIVLVLNPCGVNLQHLFSTGWLVDRCIVAHWVWETEALPDFWKEDSVSYDEIWTPTEFVEETVRASLTNFKGPIRTLPYAIDSKLIDTSLLPDRVELRNRLGIRRDIFAIGYSFSCGSNYQRKNPEAAIKQFRAAFPDDEDSVLLILRCPDLSRHNAENFELRSKITEDKRIILFDDKMFITIEEFYAVIDLYLSPSRVEGFGLNLVEASQMCIPVITSGWRLAPQIAALPHIHTVDYDLVPIVDPQGQYIHGAGKRWSEPRLESVVAKLRLLRREHHRL
jgi:glycosyltransferase involved in cell wall biosynthesis